MDGWIDGRWMTGWMDGWMETEAVYLKENCCSIFKFQKYKELFFYTSQLNQSYRRAAL